MEQIPTSGQTPVVEPKGVPGKVGNLVSFFENFGDEAECDQGTVKKTVTTSTYQSSNGPDLSKYFSGDNSNAYQTYDSNTSKNDSNQISLETTTVEQTVNGNSQSEIESLQQLESRESSSSIIVREQNGHDAEYLQNNQDSFSGQQTQESYESSSVSQSRSSETTETSNYQQAIQRVEEHTEQHSEVQKSSSYQEHSERQETLDYQQREQTSHEHVQNHQQTERLEENHQQQEEYSEQVQNEGLVVVEEQDAVVGGEQSKFDYFDPSVDTSQDISSFSQFEEKSASNPSIVPYPYFDLEEDTNAVYEALKAKGTDEKSLIAILTKRSESQRLEMVDKYQQSYGKELLPQLKKQLSGDFEDLILGLFSSKFEILIRDLHAAMKGAGTDERTLSEIICTLSDDDINYLKMCYQNAYTKSLQDAVYSETSGAYRKVLLSVLSACREDPQSCSEDNVALTLCETDSKGKPSVDETTIRTVLVSYTRPFLYGVFKAYENRTGNEFSHVIQKVCKDGDSKQALLTIYKSILCIPGFYAAELHEAMKGAGTKDSTLIRIILLRAEVDLKEIRRQYEKLNGKDFIKTIKSETSGDYRAALISIIEGNATEVGQQDSQELNQSQSRSDEIIFDSKESRL